MEVGCVEGWIDMLWLLQERNRCQSVMSFQCRTKNEM
jgi:hypothetical protein